MKKKPYILFVLMAIFVFCALCLSACQYRSGQRWSGNYWYTVENEEVTITGYTGLAKDLTIPDTINGMPVVAIGFDAFRNGFSLKSVTIPDSVVMIDTFAFFGCDALERITLGRGVKVIHDSSFADLENMSYNEYENSYYIGNEENPYLAFVSPISTDAETVTFHPDTKIICGDAFGLSKKLREIVFHEGIISIGDNALAYCSALEQVYIPQTLETLGFTVFDYCDTLQEIVVAEGNTHFKAVDGSLFSYDGTRLIKYVAGQTVASYQVPDGTVTIEEQAFRNAKHLTEVVLPDSVEEIGDWGFLDCVSLRNIHLGNGLRRIGTQAFGYCESLMQITIPNSVEEISHSAFNGCKKLETVVIGSGVVRLDNGVFASCDALQEVVFLNPTGWEVKTMYSNSTIKLDLSDPKQNAAYLTGEYCPYYWLKE